MVVLCECEGLSQNEASTCLLFSHGYDHISDCHTATKSSTRLGAARNTREQLEGKSISVSAGPEHLVLSIIRSDIQPRHTTWLMTRTHFGMLRHGITVLEACSSFFGKFPWSVAMLVISSALRRVMLKSKTRDLAYVTRFMSSRSKLR